MLTHKRRANRKFKDIFYNKGGTPKCLKLPFFIFLVCVFFKFPNGCCRLSETFLLSIPMVFGLLKSFLIVVNFNWIREVHLHCFQFNSRSFNVGLEYKIIFLFFLTSKWCFLKWKLHRDWKYCSQFKILFKNPNFNIQWNSAPPGFPVSYFFHLEVWNNRLNNLTRRFPLEV